MRLCLFLLFAGCIAYEPVTPRPDPAMSYANELVIAEVGAAVTLTPVITAGPLTTFAVMPALPDGVTLGEDGVIAGTPTTALGELSYTVTASRFDGRTATANLALRVDPSPPVLAYPSDRVDAISGRNFTFEPSSVPPNATFAFVGTAPGDVTIDPATGVISGIVTIPPDVAVTLPHEPAVEVLASTPRGEQRVPLKIGVRLRENGFNTTWEQRWLVQPDASDPYSAGTLADAANIGVFNGELRFELAKQSLWFNLKVAAHVERRVTGNFRATVRMRINNKNGGPFLADEPLAASAGLFVAYNSDLILTAGLGMNRVPGGDPHLLETRGIDPTAVPVTTARKFIDMVLPPGPTAVDLRLCRLGDEFRAFARIPSEAVWTELNTGTFPNVGQEMRIALGAECVNGTDPMYIHSMRVSIPDVAIDGMTTLAECEE